ncbi:uroporphyrinogen-III C-methyltransferase [Ornithinimicrobium pratense]|uniref:uroporphyrinogen-III C-methyltransferase n=1 Tax=Ornithinimicrobium pratense TaxID=2593973 RepID=UPI00192D6663|nr:uroporphyrinogen-III C-methyltransferase [Ornithinimicrobium pratense]
MQTEPTAGWPLPGRPESALVTRPGPRASETVHALLDRGLRVTVATGSPDARLRDLAGRGLVALADPGATDLADFDVVIRDTAHLHGGDADAPGRCDAQPGRQRGEVLLVGGGPGPLGLLTLAGAEALRAADVVVYDRLAPLGALDLAPADAERVPVGKIPRGEFTPQEQINAILVDRARQGATVVRLKGGDSFVFGRGGEEWLACASAGIPVRVVPGVTSAVAVPGLAGVPVTHRAVTPGFVVVSGHVGPDDPRNQVDWAALAGAGLTIVVLMGVATLAAIAERLVVCGLPGDTPAAVVADGGLPSQRQVTAPLEQVAQAAQQAGLGAPAVAIIGPTVAALTPG